MSDPDPAGGGGGGDGSDPPSGGGPDVTLLPVEKLVAYLSQVVPLLLEDEPGPRSQFARLLESPEGETLLVPLTKFICDAHCKSMLVQRCALVDKNLLYGNSYTKFAGRVHIVFCTTT